MSINLLAEMERYHDLDHVSDRIFSLMTDDKELDANCLIAMKIISQLDSGNFSKLISKVKEKLASSGFEKEYVGEFSSVVNILKCQNFKFGAGQYSKSYLITVPVSFVNSSFYEKNVGLMSLLSNFKSCLQHSLDCFFSSKIGDKLSFSSEVLNGFLSSDDCQRVLMGDGDLFDGVANTRCMESVDLPSNSFEVLHVPVCITVSFSESDKGFSLPDYGNFFFKELFFIGIGGELTAMVSDALSVYSSRDISIDLHEPFVLSQFVGFSHHAKRMDRLLSGLFSQLSLAKPEDYRVDIRVDETAYGFIRVLCYLGNDIAYVFDYGSACIFDHNNISLDSEIIKNKLERLNYSSVITYGSNAGSIEEALYEKLLSVID